MIHHLKIRILSHGLDFAYDLVHKAFLDQLFRQVRVEHHTHIVVGLRHETVLLRHVDQQILLGKGNFHTVHVKFQRPL